MAGLKANIAVLVSGGGTNLQALIDAEKSGIIKSGEIKLVISNKKDAFALERAKKADIKAISVSKKDFSGNEEWEDKLIETLKENNIDLIVLAGFLAILSEKFVKTFDKRIINIHPSLIPSFCGKDFYGLKVHESALKKGVKITGATVHFVNEIPDDGEIIMQKAVEVKENDTAESLQLRVMVEAEWIILPLSTEKICKKIIDNKGEK